MKTDNEVFKEGDLWILYGVVQDGDDTDEPLSWPGSETGEPLSWPAKKRVETAALSRRVS